MAVNTPTLPTVTQYIRNVGRSISYATVDSVKGSTQNIDNFIETNNDLFKTIYSASKNYRQTAREINRSFKKSKVYDAVSHGWSTFKDDMATGNWYNKARIDKDNMEALMGSDFTDFDLDDSDFFTDDDSSSSSVSKSAVTVSNVIANTAQSQNETMMSIAEYINNTNIASTKAISGQNEKIFNTVLKGFNGVTNGVSFIASVLNGPMIQYMNESSKFYGDVSNKLTEANAYLKEMAEMQRNLYKVQEQSYKENAYDNIAMGGTPDLKAYAKNIVKNLKALDPTGGMLTSNDESNILKLLIGNPAQAIPMMLAKVIVPTAITKSMESLDESFKGFFSSFIARMNKMSDDDAAGINFGGILGRIFGIKLDKKTKVDPSKFTRGPIPFDGETKKSIVDIIPAYLARIESAISGMPERTFDMKSGRFRNLREIQHSYNNIKTTGYRNATYGIEDSFEEWARQYATDNRVNNKSKERYFKNLNKKFKTLGRKIYEDGGDFRPYEGVNGYGKIDSSKNRYMSGDDAFTAEEWMSLMRYLQEHDKKGVYSIARDTIDAIQSNSATIAGHEGGFGNIYNALFDGRIQALDKNGRLRDFDPTKDSKFSLPVSTTNQYLKDILAEVRYMRKNGVKGSVGVAGGKGSDKDFDKFYKDNFADKSDIDDPYIQAVDPWFRPTEREETEAERYGLTKQNIMEYRAAKTFSEKWKAIQHFTDDLLKTPAKLVTGVIKTADERMFSTLFGTDHGKEYKDKDGTVYHSFMEYLMARTGRMFDTLQKKVEDAWKQMVNKFKASKFYNEFLKPKFEPFVNDMKDRFGDKWSKLKDRLGQVIPGLRSSIIDPINAQELARQQKIARDQAWDSGDQYAYYDLPMRHNGGVVTKYGMTMLSPGEIVIPNMDPKVREKNRIGENREKAKILKILKGGHIDNNYEGTIDAIKGTARNAAGKVSENPEYQKAMKAVRTVTREVKGNWADVAVDALIGSGVSLVTGLIGGPILGAAAGTGFGLVQHSETLQKVLFGKVGENGEREGGVIPKSIQDFFKKHSKGMIDFGVAGAAAGLFTPLGLVGGAMAGAALGYAKDTKTFKDYVFGNVDEDKEGLISKDTVDKIKKAYPKMLIGAGAGILAGPFGLVGNILIGASAGYVSTTNAFKDMMLGKEGKDGEREGGVIGAVKNGLVKPLAELGLQLKEGVLDFVKKKVLNPSSHFIKTSTRFLKNAVTEVGARISDGINGVFQKHVGMPLEEFLREKLFKRLSDFLGALIRGPGKFIANVATLPFQALGGIANRMDMRMIQRGSYTGSTAAERIQTRGKHKISAKLGSDKTLELDKSIANSDTAQLEALKNQIDQFTSNRGKKNVALVEKAKKAGAIISQYFTDNGLWDVFGHRLFNKGAAYVVKNTMVNDYIMKGRVDELEEYFVQVLVSAGKLDQDTANGLASGLIAELDIAGLKSAFDQAKEERETASKGIEDLEKLTGMTNLHKKGNTFLRNLSKNLGYEIKSRNKPAAKEAAEAVAPEIKTANNVSTIVTKLSAINRNLILIGSGKKDGFVDGEEKPVPSDEQATEVVQTQDGALKVDRNGNPVSGNKQNSITLRLREARLAVQEKLSAGMNRLGDLFGGFGKKDDGEKKDTLLDKIKAGLGKAGSAFGSIAGKGLGILGKVGLVVGGVLGISMLGHASEFLKTKVTPWMEEHVFPKVQSLFDRIKETKLYKAASGFFGSIYEKIKSGEIWTDLAAHTAQGVRLAMKNVVAPLTEALITSIPDIILGIGKGVLHALWPGKKNEVQTDISKTLNAAMTSYNTESKDERAIAEKAGISSRINVSNVNGTIKFDTEYADADSSDTEGKPTSSTKNGVTSYYSKDGNFLGSTDQNGDIVSTSVYSDGTEHGISGGLIKGTTNAFKRGLATGRTPLVAKGISKLGSKITGGAIVKDAVKGTIRGPIGAVVGGVKSLTKGLVKGAGSLFSKSANAGTIVNQAIQANAANTAGSAVRAAANVAKSESLGGRIAAKIANFGTKLANSSFINTILSKAIKPIKNPETVKKAIETLFKKSSSKVVNLAGEKIAKIASKVALGVTPLTLIFWAASFVSGYERAETLLGIAKDAGLELSWGARIVCGIVNAINDNLLLGLVPMDWLLEQAVKLFQSIFSFSEEDLENARQTTAELLTKQGINTGEEKTLDEYNDQETWGKKLGTAVSKLFNWDGEAEETSTGSNTSSLSTTSGRTSNRSNRRHGRGRFSGKGTQGGIYAGMKYGRNSTIGKSGCGPVAAANIMNSNIPDAAMYAQSNGYVSADGSTDIGFFNDYFNSKGISNRTTFDKRDTANAIKNGNRVVLLGQDHSNDPGSAYSRNPHFITTDGMIGNGRVKVYDPELGYRALKMNELTKSMKASVITGKSGKGRRHGLFGLVGRGDDDEIPNKISNVNTIIEVARSQIGYVGGSNSDSTYGREYGMNYQPWCVMFVWWVFKTAGLSKLFYGGSKTASCSALNSWAKSNSRFVSSSGVNAKAGDLILFNFNGGSSTQHIGICIKDYDGSGYIDTIDGNTSKPSSYNGRTYSHAAEANGNGVFQKHRAVKTVVAVIRPAYNDAKAFSVRDIAKTTGTKFAYNSGLSEALGTASTGEQSTGTSFFDTITTLGKNIVKAAFGENLYNAVTGEQPETEVDDTSMPDTTTTSTDTSGTGRYHRSNYASRVNTNYSNYKGGERSITGTTTPTVRKENNTSAVSYDDFMNSIITILMTISTNTEALKTILEILSDEFNVTATTDEVKNATSSREKARQSLKKLMNSKSTAEDVSSMLQTKNTEYIVKAMSEIARE